MQFKSLITGEIIDVPAHFADLMPDLQLEQVNEPVDESCHDCAFEQEGDCLCDE